MNFLGLDLKFHGFDVWHKGNFNPDNKSNVGHKHTKSDVTDFPSSMPANGGNADTVDNKHASAFAPIEHKYHSFNNGQYFFDSYSQGNYLRLFTELATYDTVRFSTISNIQYYNGSAWQDWSSNASEIQKLLDGREETGTSIDHTHKQFRFTINKTTGWCLSALIVLQGTWTGITYPGITVTIENSSDGGSTWTIKETCNFDSSHTGGDHGIHMKVSTNLHDGKSLSRVTIQINDWTDNGSYTTIPLRRFMILSNYSGRVLQPFSWGYTKVVNFEATPTVSGNHLWHTGNDGSGSGLDADLLDGKHLSDIQTEIDGKANASHTHTKSQVTDMPTKLSQFQNDIGAGGGVKITTASTAPSSPSPGDFWYKEI